MNEKLEFDYSEYGVFDGKPFIPSLNREERRKYKKQYKNSNWYCPKCNYNVQVVSDDECNICCTCCGKIIGTDRFIAPKDFTTHIEGDSNE